MKKIIFTTLMAILLPSFALANYRDNYYDNNGYYHGNYKSEQSYSDGRIDYSNDVRIKKQTYYMPDLSDQDFYNYYNNYTRNYPHDNTSLQDFKRMQMILVRVEFKDKSDNYVNNQPINIINDARYTILGLCDDTNNNSHYQCDTGNGVIIFAIILRTDNNCYHESTDINLTIRIELTNNKDVYDEITPKFENNDWQNKDYNSSYYEYINSKRYQDYKYPYDMSDFERYNSIIWNARQNYRDSLYNTQGCDLYNHADTAHPNSTINSIHDQTTAPDYSDTNKTQSFWMILLGYITN